jgi:hypothetical protein
MLQLAKSRRAVLNLHRSEDCVLTDDPLQWPAVEYPPKRARSYARHKLSLMPVSTARTLIDGVVRVQDNTCSHHEIDKSLASCMAQLQKLATTRIRRKISIQLYYDKQQGDFTMSDPSTGKICEQCKSLLIRPSEPLRIDRILNSSSRIEVQAESIPSFAAIGCPICTLAEHYLHLQSLEKHMLFDVRVLISLVRTYDGDVFSGARPTLLLEDSSSLHTFCMFWPD